jgi:hypothetical protein
MMAAAAHFGISYDGVRRRIARGKLQAIHRDGRVYVVLPAPAPCTGQPAELRRTSPDIPPDTAPDSTGQGTEQPPDTARQVAEHALAERDRLVTTLESEVAWLRDQLLAEQSARRRVVSELHVLLQRAQQHQAAIVAPASAADPDASMAAQRRRRWWWPW